VNTFHDNHYGWKRTGIQLLLVVAVAFAGVNLATQAAFPDTPKKSLSENRNFWQGLKNNQEQETDKQTRSANTETDTTQITKADVAVDASSYLVADLQTGEMLAGKNIRDTHPIASITKLMTAVVAHETINDQSPISISRSAVSTYGSAGNLTAGDSFTLSTLYYPLLLPSSNDTAAAIAEHAGGRRFINQMNRKALAIGMNKTRFADASGLSANNVASPEDIINLAEYIYDQHPFIFSITAKAQKAVPANYPRESYVFVNNHPLHSQPNFLGGKNGYTDKARYTLLSVFEIEKSEQERPVAIVVLDSDQQITDTRKLLRWTENL
jgi:D-alanyl-D-alanine carboxypeptidase